MTLSKQEVNRRKRQMVRINKILDKKEKRQQTPYDIAIISLINAWNSVCPEEDKGHLDLVLKEIDDCGGDYILTTLTGRLYDGLAYGNWPSAVKKAMAK